ncbi:MAG TPA: hypothetical protein P5081_21645 [Phycisphaerae bacterium]|nr:hypothetical protein [Phycisphaerae bacterium]HRW55486.1 hypothetical protein [Phycisphaerae bacterium]
MDCQTARKWMSPYLDSELETAKTFEISEHLRACECCRHRFDAERRVDEMVGARLKREAMPPEVWSTLRREVNRSHLLHRLRVPSVVAAAACLALFAMVYFKSGGSSPSRREAFQGEWALYVNEAPKAEEYISTDEIEAALKKEYGLSFSTSRKDTHGHPIEVIGARHVLFGSQPALELRLKCCGKVAVITAVHQADADKLPEDLRELTKSAAGRSVSENGVNVRVDSIGATEYFIASEHYLDGLVGVMKDGRA